ncbi:MAG TPA: TonB family protein [Terriglobales bacterium]|nr:TonB family protein [Terriglobales bacterium]
MLAALGLLGLALALVIIKDRDFWFPPASAPLDSVAATAPSAQPDQAQTGPLARTRHFLSRHSKKHSAPSSHSAQAPPPPVTIKRTALPPLEVEVVAGDQSHTARPVSRSVQVDTQPSSAGPELASQRITDTATVNASTPPVIVAADRVSLSPQTNQAVSHSVKPGYPLLARQTKVQGAVMLEALISREGNIQDLRVLSGPPILAAAAREAVKKWRFKPYFEGNRAVETAARITVNFTISTN